jgi:hypothetical protein
MRESPFNPNLNYSWQQVVFDALIEFHPEHISKKLTAAETAISERLLQRNLDTEEVLALRDALSALKVVYSEARLKVESAERALGKRLFPTSACE